jgi:hypothetical protein
MAKRLRQITYDPLPFQEKFHQSLKPKVYLSGGYGCGKTHSLCMKAFQLVAINRGLPGGLLAPTLKMFKKDVLPTMRSIARENGIPMKFNRSDSIFSFPEMASEIYVFHGEDDGESIRGPNLAFMLMNEVTLLSKGAFDAAIARVRLKSASLLQVAMSGTPEGFNWAYDYFIANPRVDTDLIFGDVRLNPHVAESYVQMLMESYDEKLVAQFLEGKFININQNQAAYAFHRQKHLNAEIQRIPNTPIWISMDFNVNPMTATLWQKFLVNGRPRLQALDEISLGNSTRIPTEELADAIKSKVNLEEEDVTIYPDPAGNARKTSSNKTDIEILRLKGFNQIKYKPKIASVRDCLNAVNNCFDKNMIEIHPRCKNLIQDLEQCSVRPGTGELDKSDPKRTHALDGMKNMIDYEFPIRAQRGSWREEQVR